MIPLLYFCCFVDEESFCFDPFAGKGPELQEIVAFGPFGENCCFPKIPELGVDPEDGNGKFA